MPIGSRLCVNHGLCAFARAELVALAALTPVTRRSHVGTLT